MITRNKLIILILIIFQLGCAENKIEKYDIGLVLETKASIARKTGQAIKIELCNVNSFKWDRIVLVHPYSTDETIDSYKLDNPKFIKKHLLNPLYLETSCLLLFVEKNTVMKYCYVPNEVINFSYINNIDTIKIISRKIACEQLYIKNVNTNLRLFY